MEQHNDESVDLSQLVDTLVENIRNMHDDDMGRIVTVVSDEQARRSVIRNARADADRAAQRYEDAVKDDPPKEYAPGDVIGPGDKIVEDGVEYVNTSHAWLSVPPSQYPLGFERTEPPAETVPDFTPGEDVTPGDLRRYEGVVYEVIQGHTTAAHWPPNAAHSLWSRSYEDPDNDDTGGDAADGDLEGGSDETTSE